MPICEIDPWRMQYFERVACPADVLISTEDSDSWTWYPRHRWVYDKVAVALSQGLEAAPHGVEPKALSGVLQADHEPEGHGRRQPRAARRRRLRDALRARPHVDDLARRPPRLVRRRGARTASRYGGATRPASRARRARSTTGPSTPRPTRRSRRMRRVDRTASRRLHRHDQSRNHRRAHHRGASALRRPVAGPLRRGLGRGAGAALQHDRWDYPDADRRDGYSVVLFGPHGPRYRHPPQALVDEVRAMPSVSSVQITFHEDKPPDQHAMPPGGFRLAIVNCLDLAPAARRARSCARSS